MVLEKEKVAGSPHGDMLTAGYSQSVAWLLK